MTVTMLIGFLVLMLGVRLSFLWRFLMTDPELLWSDFERRGDKYKLAWLLDLATFGFFFGVSALTVYKLHEMTFPLVRVFVVFLGLSLLIRLRVHRFPRTNVPRAFEEAKADLIVHLVMSVLSGIGMVIVTTIYLWWRSR